MSLPIIIANEKRMMELAVALRFGFGRRACYIIH
jgi:hypothetical protein